MAVGIIMGAAFTAIVTSMVDDLVNPIIGFFIGGIDFSDMVMRFGDGDNAAAVRYGSFINAIIKFVIVAWVVFLLVKGVNRVKEAAMAEAESPAEETQDAPSSEQLLAEIRDLMKTNAAPATPAPREGV
jgi:large conductance mechanosensitive channel